MRFKIDWPSLLLGRKLTVFLCFTLYLRAIFKYKSGGGGGLYLEGAIYRKVFCVTSLRRLLFGGAYFRNFTVVFGLKNSDIEQ